MTKKLIFLIENHHEAYFLWKKNRIKNYSLIHIDAHLDLRIDYLFRVSDSYIDIGNFIFPAIKEGIVKDIYWIIPGRGDLSCIDLFAIKRCLQNIQSHDQLPVSPIIWDKKKVLVQICGVQLTICKIVNLPTIKKKVLIDIDVDFFVTAKNNHTQPEDPKKQWISVAEFVNIIHTSQLVSELTTISYSVEGGWTPLIFKAIGDSLAQKLGSLDKDINQRIIAGDYYSNFIHELNKGRIRKAKQYYQKAVILNPTYKSNLAEMGMVYLRNKELKQARRILEDLFKIDSSNNSLLYGLAITYFESDQFRLAKKLLLQIKDDEKKYQYIFIYLACIEIHFGYLHKAKLWLIKHLQCYPNNPWHNLLSSYLEDKFNNKTNLDMNSSLFFDYERILRFPIGLERILRRL